MKRRDFIKNVAPLAVVPFFSNKLSAAAYDQLPLITQAAVNMAVTNDKVLVLVQLNGGNDGLNTVIPLDQYTNLSIVRNNILIPQNAVLQLGNTQTGLHPALSGLKNLYDANKLTVIQSVGYANPNFSHFRATDIWNTGSNANQVLDSGWLGRFLEYEYPGAPAGYPNASMGDPLAIQIGTSVPLSTQGQAFNLAQSIPYWYTGSLTQLLGYSNANIPATNAGNEASFIRTQQSTANQYATSIQTAYNSGTNMSTYPSTGNLGAQLKLVAKLIKGGMKTKVFLVNQSSYDTHSIQVDPSNFTIGAHATLLKELGDSIFAFQEDMRLMGLEDKVLGMTFSEFGRTINSNASSGTDHGTAAPMFFFGKNVSPGIRGTNPIIPSVVNWNTYLPNQFDYRETYLSMLTQWFCLAPSTANTVMGNSSFTPINGAVLCNNALVLPIELAQFNVERSGKNAAHLAWATLNENNAAYMEVQRSSDGIRFEAVTNVTAKGHAHGLETYEYNDINLNITKIKTYYYRLKMVDIDGKFDYSATKSITFANENNDFGIQITPNPNDGHFSILVNDSIDANVESEISVVDTYGRLLQHTFATVEPNVAYKFDIESLSTGIYFVTFVNGKQSVVRRVLIK